MANLIEGLQTEIKRCYELVDLYNTIPQGTFGATMIKQDIIVAEKAISEGDPIEMIRCYKTLKECQ